ncbi:MAG: protein kinase [Planctomycetota bacterium]|nr:protein kinase [Planctomycetota bacterium]MDA1251781.1 protein kinase [Planctomycetota bacterium]
MSEDRVYLFGFLAVRRKLLTQEQLDQVSDKLGDDETLDESLVRSGLMSASDRQELWAEIDRLETKYSGNVPRIIDAIQAGPGESTFSEKHTSTTDQRPRPDPPQLSEQFNDLGATVIAHREETVDVSPRFAPPPDASGDDSVAKTSSASSSDLLNRNEQTNPFEETFISRAEKNDEADGSEVFEQSIESRVDPDAGILQTVDRGSSPADPEAKETVDYEPETHSRYTLTRVHGEGGLGQVWLAVDPSLNRDVALKRIRPGKAGSRDAQLRLIREAQITGQLEHPNIMPVYELEQRDEKGRPYYTMKFLRGDTLQDRIKSYHRKKKNGKAEPIDLVKLLNFFIDICNAIAYAASRGVVHRDLKPQNVMIGDFGEVIVLDWGLAKKIDSQEIDSGRRELRLGELVDATETVAGQVVGSPAYMAPEQAAALNDQVDARTDVYGLGAMLFTILIGHPPHRGTKTGKTAKDTIELLNRISSGETPRLRDLDPTIPPALDAICAKAMDKGARLRYQDARDLGYDIECFLADEAVTVFKESPLQMVGRWLRKHRTKAQAIAVTLVVVAVVSTISAITVNDAKNQEAIAKEEALAHFEQARRSIDKSLIELSDKLEEYPGVQELRTRLLEDAAKEYEALAEQKSDQPELKLEIARSLVRLAEVRRLLRDFENAEPTFKRALTALEPLIDFKDQQSSVRLELAKCLNGLGLCWHKLAPMPKDGDAGNSVDKAGEHYGLAAKTAKEALKTDTGNVELQRMLARITGNQGTLLATTDRLSEAFELSRQAVELYRVLASDPGEISDREELARALTALAMAMNQQGEFEASRKALSEAIRIYDRLVKLEPNSTRFLQGLADARLTLANVMSSDGALTERLSLYEECAADYLALVSTRPDVPGYRSSLVVAETNIAQVLYRLGENNDALMHVQTALEQAMTVVNADQTNPESHALEVYVRVTFGQILRDLSMFSDAELAFKSSDDICRELVEAFSENGSYRRLYGEVKNNVGILYLLDGPADDAQQAFVSAIVDFDSALKINPRDTLARNGRAWALNYLADAQLQLGQVDKAARSYGQAIAERTNLCGTTNAGITEYHVARAWLLLTCPDESLRDVVAGEAIAEGLVMDDPGSGQFHMLHALAQLRAKNYPGSITSLNKTALVRMSKKSPVGFIRAMALWLNGNKPGAVTAWESADKLMNEAAPGDIKLRQLRVESAKLLGIDQSEKSPEPESGTQTTDAPKPDGATKAGN